LYETLRMLFSDMDDMRKEEAAAKDAALAAALGSPGCHLAAERGCTDDSDADGDGDGAFNGSPTKLSPAKVTPEPWILQFIPQPHNLLP
jgi:hypothetical protein